MRLATLYPGRKTRASPRKRTTDMAVTGNTFNNNRLAQMMQKAGPGVTSAIQNASARTGVNFAYLMEKAAAESSFDAKAQSKTSSAAGLYQFIESTWLQMVRDHGDDYGLGEYAKHIDSKGHVDSKAMRKEILDLRKDPDKAACMAAEFAADNQRYMQDHLGADGKDIGSTELYLAHFMGAGGATAFLKAYHDNPLGAAADLFPQAARANRNVFYDSKTGQPRTLASVYDFFDKKFSNETGIPAIATVNATGSPGTAAVTPPHKPQAARTASVASAAMHRPLFPAQDDSVPSFYQTRRMAGTNRTVYSFIAGGTKTDPAAFRGAVQTSELLFLAQLQAPGNASPARKDDDEEDQQKILSRRSPLFILP